jgi:hypothetical protein
MKKAELESRLASAFAKDVPEGTRVVSRVEGEIKISALKTRHQADLVLSQETAALIVASLPDDRDLVPGDIRTAFFTARDYFVTIASVTSIEVVHDKMDAQFSAMRDVLYKALNDMEREINPPF